MNSELSTNTTRTYETFRLLPRPRSEGIVPLRAMPRVPPPAPFDRHAPPTPVATPTVSAHRTPSGTAVVPSSPVSAPSAWWIDDPALVGDRRTGGERVSIALVRCAPPRETLERAAMSDFTPPPHAALVSWQAFWADDERYMLRGLRADGGVEWYAVALVPDERAADDQAAAMAPRTPVARARTALVGWRPVGCGNAARWSVAWRRR